MLAALPWPCFIRTHVQLDRFITVLRQAAKPALASLLIALVIWLVTFGGTSSFHESLHTDSAGDGACVICLFTHSQVDTATVGALPVFFFAVCIGLVPLARQMILTALDLRLAPSRAPPRFSVPSTR